MVIFWQDCYGKGNLRKILLKNGWEKVPNWECLFVHREKGLFVSVYVDDLKKWLERNETLIGCRNYSTKKLIWENQHLSSIMKTWDGLNSKTMLNKQRYCGQLHESRISPVRTEKASIL